MSKKDNKALVPELRFPEFQDEDEWTTREFRELIELVVERAGTRKYTLMSVTAGVGLVSQLDKFGREIAGNAYKNYYVIRKGDFAYNKSATKQFPEGYIAMLTDYDKAALPNSIFTCFRIIDDNTYPKFFDHLFHANYHGFWLRKFIAVGARAHGSLNVDTKHLLDMPVALPSLSEQQKIADCLTSLDELTSAENRKLEAYKAHKKGLMQKLLPAEGQAVPEWRFPEFRNEVVWVEKKLDEVGGIITGKTPSTSDDSLWNGDIQFVTPTDITEEKYLTSTQRTVLNNSKIKPLPRLSIMFTCIASIGKMALSVNPCITNQQINSIIPYPKYENEFIYYALLKISFSIKSKLANSALPIINKTDFSKLLISIPSEKEQQGIVDCLSSLDELINAQNQKINALKAYKKGLMQRLFPVVNEVGV
jgi:type I restriction enzyme S subunit